MPAAAERHDALLSSRVVHGVRRSGGHTGAATAAGARLVGRWLWGEGGPLPRRPPRRVDRRALREQPSGTVQEWGASIYASGHTDAGRSILGMDSERTRSVLGGQRHTSAHWRFGLGVLLFSANVGHDVGCGGGEQV